MSSSSHSSRHVESAVTGLSWDAAVFVWSLWTLMLGAALWFAWTYGSKYPYFDDFGLVLWLSGEYPVTAEWLWETYNDHRIPLPRLLWVILYRVFGGDFRAGMVFNIVCVGALAAALIWAARKMRGRTSYSDAFFPLLFLTWQGKLSLFLWSFILQLTLSTVLAGAVLAIIASECNTPSIGKTVLAGLCIALLPLCGANGVVMAPALAIWLGIVGLWRWLSSGRATGAILPFGLCTLALGLIALYFVGFHRDMSSADGGLWSILKSGCMFLSMALGMSAEWVYTSIVVGIQDGFIRLGLTSWAERRLPYAVLGLVAAILLIVTPLVWIWLTRPTERFRALGLTFFFAACACLTLAIGFGRGEGAVFEQYRYIILATPRFACIYLIWTLLDSSMGRLVQMTMFLLFCVLFPRNIEIALESARKDRADMQRFEDKMQAGVPLLSLVDEFTNVFLLEDDQPARERVAGYILLMKKHGDKHYAALRHDDLPLGVRIDFTKPLSPGLFLDSGWHGVLEERLWSGREPTLKFALPEKLKIQPLRLRMMVNTFEPQPIDVVLNGDHLATLQGDGGPPRLMEVDLPPLANLYTEATPGVLREYNILKFNLPKAHSPHSVGKGADNRPLGLGVLWMEFTPKPASSP